VTITMGVGLPATVDPPALDGAGPALRSEVAQSRPRAAPLPSTEQEAARLTELLRLHYASVWRTLRRLGVADGSADDAAQEVFIVLSRRLSEVRQGSERTFLLSCAVRIAANYRRTWHAQHEVADERALATEQDPRPTADQLLDHKRLREAFDEIVDGWTEDLRTAFVLFELEGLSAPEISQVTETKLGTVASRLRRARELFQAGAKRLRLRAAAGGEP
jgi:RNA polymerase sigma-70 factor (ECF subfamily)